MRDTSLASFGSQTSHLTSSSSSSSATFHITVGSSQVLATTSSFIIHVFLETGSKYYFIIAVVFVFGFLVSIVIPLHVSVLLEFL